MARTAALHSVTAPTVHIHPSFCLYNNEWSYFFCLQMFMPVIGNFLGLQPVCSATMAIRASPKLAACRFIWRKSGYTPSSRLVHMVEGLMLAFVHVI
ncbi:hypothetical protein CFC21_099033 [Triticum aestivum]|uniref:Uncharacterized protein n=2 Tax=Triticum aestivum TaxID=4565 RepID=A0A9R1LY65_WHEAT|nr:hypothetical protein CFC21_099033 [Triticum aestivum]